MLKALCDNPLAPVRHGLALFMLISIVAFVPLSTIYHNSAQTNNFVAIVQVLVFLLLFRESLRGMRDMVARRDHLFLSAFLLLSIVVIVASYIKSGGYYRAQYYISGIFLFFSLVYLFDRFDWIFYSALWLKVASVLVVSVIFCVSLVSDGVRFYEYVVHEPPVYTSIRHYNYDLMLALGAISLLSVAGRIGFFAFCLFFLVFSVFSVWTGGRGQLLSVLIMLFFLGRAGCYRESVVGLLLLLVAFLLVFVSGESQFLLGQIDKTVQDAAVDDISSGRLTLWYQTWNVGLEGGFLGHGADSFRAMVVGHDHVVQPHNSFLQFFFEYGFLGLGIAIFFFLGSGLICFLEVLSSASSKISKFLASFVLSMYAYGLVTGIFYHAIPLSFMIIVGAMYFSGRNSESIR